MKRLLITLAAICALCAASAQEVLLLSPDAKNLGMGGVTMGTLPSAHAIYTNPAAAIFSATPMQLSTSYMTQSDFNYYAVSGSWRMNNNNLIQGGWRQLRPTSGANQMAVDLGYSRRIGEQLAVGVVARYLHLKDYSRSEDALSIDLSAAYAYILPTQTHTVLRAGAKLSNLGGYFNNSSYAMPTNFTLGAALDTFLSDAHELIVGIDGSYYFSPSVIRGFEASVGVEYNLMQLFQLRGGYHVGQQRDYTPSYASLGAGVRFMHLRLDFAYLFAQKHSPLLHAYSFSFGLDF